MNTFVICDNEEEVRVLFGVVHSPSYEYWYR